jgi:hypothetical protein
VYYGATTKLLCDRLTQHKSSANSTKGRKCTSKQLFDIGNVQIFLVENFPCDSKEQLNARERHWIENNKCVNKCLPMQTNIEKKEYRKEFYEANKEQILENQKVYREEHREARRTQQKTYHSEQYHCKLCDCHMRRDNIAKHARTKKHMALITR